jgi:hypothetical protein
MKGSAREGISGAPEVRLAFGTRDIATTDRNIGGTSLEPMWLRPLKE